MKAAATISVMPMAFQSAVGTTDIVALEFIPMLLDADIAALDQSKVCRFDIVALEFIPMLRMILVHWIYYIAKKPDHHYGDQAFTLHYLLTS